MATNDGVKDLIDLFETKLDLSNEYPFLVDPDSIEFVKNSKVIHSKFINK